MIWGVSFALHEQTISDRRSGRIINANLAEYHGTSLAGMS
jgi:xanthine dehydrogenase YagR molybdenum-binding subunit